MLTPKAFLLCPRKKRLRGDYLLTCKKHACKVPCMKSGAGQLRDWMERRGFNQTETANYLAFDMPYISQLVNGARNPGLANAVHIERKTCIPVEAWATTADESAEREPALAGKRRIAKG